MSTKSKYELAYEVARKEVAKPLSLGYGCFDIGKRVKASKRRFFWQFMFGPEGKPYKVELILSVLSGKRLLLLDGIEKAQASSNSNSDFFHTIPIETHVIRVESKGEEIQASLDFIPFDQVQTRDTLSRAQVEALQLEAHTEATKLLEQRFGLKKPPPAPDLMTFSPGIKKKPTETPSEEDHSNRTHNKDLAPVKPHQQPDRPQTPPLGPHPTHQLPSHRTPPQLQQPPTTAVSAPLYYYPTAQPQQPFMQHPQQPQQQQQHNMALLQQQQQQYYQYMLQQQQQRGTVPPTAWQHQQQRQVAAMQQYYYRQQDQFQQQQEATPAGPR